MWKFTNVSVLLMWLLATTVKAQWNDSSPGQEFDVAQSETESFTTTTTTPRMIMTTESADVPQTGCKFPEGMAGNWLSTLWGDVSFSESNLVLDFGVGGHEHMKTLECFAMSDDGEYVIRSVDTFTFHRVDFQLYTCIKLEKRNEDNYHVIVKTDRNRDANNEPVRGEVVTMDYGDEIFNEICNASFINWIKGDLLRKDREIDGALGCSEKLKGVFNVSFQDFQTKSRCENGATMTSCDDPKTLVLDYSSCHENATQEFSDEDKYICVSGSTSKVLLYHQPDEQNSFTPFSCLVITDVSNIGEGDESVVQAQATHVGNGCDDGWQLPSSDQRAQTERFIITQVDDCEEDVVTTTLAPVENSTMPVDDNQTMPGDDNQTMPGNGSGSSNNTGNAEDAAPSLGSNGFVVTFIVAFLAILLNDYARLDS